MASSREQRIRAQKRNQFEQRQQVNRLYAQRLREGMTPAQAATTPYVVKDTDTLESIAAASGVNPTSILDKNPEVKNIQTGMVINTPRPGSEAWRVQNAYGPGGVGLPSNAALGGTTNNPQGSNPFGSVTGNAGGSSSSGPIQLPNYPKQDMGVYQPYPLYRNSVANALGQASTKNPKTPVQLPQRTDMGMYQPYPLYRDSVINAMNQSQQPRQPYPLYAQNIQNLQQSQQPATTQPATAAPSPAPPRRTVSHARGNLVTLLDSFVRDIEGGAVPNDFQLKMLEKHGRIVKDASASFGGGFGYNRRRGGGGGGRRRATPAGGGGTGVPREPAFSTGQGGFGLINWRI